MTEAQGALSLSSSAQPEARLAKSESGNPEGVKPGRRFPLGIFDFVSRFHSGSLTKLSGVMVKDFFSHVRYAATHQRSRCPGRSYLGFRPG